MLLISLNTLILAMDHHSQQVFEQNWDYLQQHDGATVFKGGNGTNDKHCFASQAHGSLAFDFVPDEGCGELRDRDGKTLTPAGKSEGMFWFTVLSP